MKKNVIVLLALIAMSASAFAQKGEKSVGLSLGYGTEIESLGIGARFQYNFTDQLRIAPEFVYYIPNNNLDMWDLNVNAHYLFPLQNNLKVYPLAGLIFSHASVGEVLGVDVDFSDSSFGINLGGGIQYDLKSNISLFGELKYGIVSDWDQATISVGAAYKF